MTDRIFRWEMRNKTPDGDYLASIHDLTAQRLREFKAALSDGKTVIFTVNGQEVGRVSHQPKEPE